MRDTARFEQVLGAAALRNWADLPRDVQELLFEDATEANEALRQELAVYIHSHYHRDGSPGQAGGDATAVLLAPNGRYRDKLARAAIAKGTRRV